MMRHTYDIVNYWAKRVQEKVRDWVGQPRRMEREREAYSDLSGVGGPGAVKAMQASLAKAEQYRRWNGWALERAGIVWLAKLILEQGIRRIVEFGAGYSTVALTEFLRQVHAKDTHMDSFEHVPEFVERIRIFLPEETRANLHCIKLLQVEDAVFEGLFDAPDPCGDFIASACLVPAERYLETRLRNLFYGFDFRTWPPASVDLMILDGPNGNGRSLAFPFLKKTMRLPGWVLVDDYRHHPYLNYLQRVFVGHVVQQVDAGHKNYALVKLSGLCLEPQSNQSYRA